MTNPPKFQLDAKTLFLTIPQISEEMNMNIAYDRLLEKYKDRLNCFIISTELHKEEGRHLHLYINFKDRFRTKAQNIFDFIADKHPNIQSAKCPIKVIKYVIKDGDYITYNIDVENYLNDINEHKPRQSKGQFYELSQTIKEGIKDGNLSLKELNENHGDLFIKYGEHIKKYIKFCEDLNDKEDIDKYYKDMFKNIEWNKLQRRILDIIDTDKIDNRKINWIYDRTGNNGKSTIANYLELYKNAYIITGGKHADIYRHYSNNRIVIYDLPRDYIDNNESLYATMETFKNGYCLDTKYEGQKKRFIPPHIIVFSNSKPDLNKLSKDRWNIIDVEEFNCDSVIEIKAEINEELIETLKNANEITLPIIRRMDIEDDKKPKEDDFKEHIKILLELPKIHKKLYLDRYEYNEFTRKFYDTKLSIWFEI